MVYKNGERTCVGSGDSSRKKVKRLDRFKRSRPPDCGDRSTRGREEKRGGDSRKNQDKSYDRKSQSAAEFPGH